MSSPAAAENGFIIWWRLYLLTLGMIISISGLSATQVGCEENKGANVSHLMPLQGDVDVPAIQVQIISSWHAWIRSRLPHLGDE